MAPLATIAVHRGCNRWRCGALVAFAVVDAADEAEVSRYHWTLDSNGYASRSYRDDAGAKHRITMHRQLLGLTTFDPLQGDHINRVRLDNRRSNLRVVTTQLNGQNKRAFRGSASGLRGVAPEGRRWRAYASIEGRRKHLGTFPTKEAAAEVAARARLEHMAGAVD